jgi:hypothetical protein
MASLAEQALNNLVDQFARPLDFLRELVQNALDAGSPRIEVRTDYNSAQGVFVLSVTDFGHGMTREIIDRQLTRLFASQKQGDLTQIGRFGIGFASVFSLRPDDVWVTTGRIGESWEVHFDAERTFTVTALETPVVGTVVTLSKRMDSNTAQRTQRQAAYVLAYWCEHSERPVVLYEDGVKPSPDTVSDDPFASFAQPIQSLKTVSRPLGLDDPITAMARRDEIRVFISATDSPRFGFYSHGLTLVSTEDVAVLGDYADRLRHLNIKVAGPGLDHTLTRDNVIQDDMWHRAMRLTLDVRKELRKSLLRALHEAAVSGADDDALLRWLAADLAPEGTRSLPDGQPLFRDTTGIVRTLTEVEDQEDDLAVLLVGDVDHPVVHALTAQGRFVLPDTPAIRSVFRAFPRKRMLGIVPKLRTLRTATDRFFLPQRIPDSGLGPVDLALLTELKRIALIPGFRHLHFGRFGGVAASRHEPVAIPVPNESGVILRNLDAPIDTDVLINHGHPTIRALRLLARSFPTAAAFAILQVILTARGATQQEHAHLYEAMTRG